MDLVGRHMTVETTYKTFAVYSGPHVLKNCLAICKITKDQTAFTSFKVLKVLARLWWLKAFRLVQRSKPQQGVSIKIALAVANLDLQ